MTIIPAWLLVLLEGIAIGYAAIASGALDWWIRKLKQAKQLRLDLYRRIVVDQALWFTVLAIIVCLLFMYIDLCWAWNGCP